MRTVDQRPPPQNETHYLAQSSPSSLPTLPPHPVATITSTRRPLSSVVLSCIRLQCEPE